MRQTKTTPPPAKLTYTMKVREHADKLEVMAERILKQVAELRASADRIEGK
jgi:hypothetical protein